MERFKRAFTLRKKKPHTKALLDSNTKPTQWNDDEKKVRDGCCSFQVKYLGSIEVFESRGMPVCEEAMKQLLKYKSKKKSKKAILYVSGDALRVTEEISKGLIVDQVIEKVSFCAPDRNHKRGFAYICRDATTRRWLCHGFKAVKESGERLSHAVGCAFAVCLEKKQQREKDSVDVTFNENKTSFTRLGSFRQATITERRLDPQSVIIAEPITSSNNINPNNIKSTTIQSSIPRPHASQSALERQSSMKIFPKLQEQNNPFKRDHSVKITDLAAYQERKDLWNNTSTISEEVVEIKDQPISTVTGSTSAEHINPQLMLNDNVNAISQNTKEPDFNNLFVDDPFSAAPINPAIHIKPNFVNEFISLPPFNNVNMFQHSMRVPNSEKLFPGTFQSNNNYFHTNSNNNNSSKTSDNNNNNNDHYQQQYNNNTNYWNTTGGANQYKSFSGKISTTWSDDILKPAVKETAMTNSNNNNNSTDKSSASQVCANSSHKNPFDVTWVHNSAAAAATTHTAVSSGHNSNNNGIVSNHNTNPFKT